VKICELCSRHEHLPLQSALGCVYSSVLGDALMDDRSKKNWVAEPLPAPWWDNAFAIAIAVTIVMAAALALFG
jgi:hypothetical protein